jgi:uncharacterized protein (TIGR03083 family)
MARSNWDTIHAERHALADDLAGVSDQAWATPSMCTGWNVQQMLGHMTATARMSPVNFLGKMAASGFRFGRMAQRLVEQESAGSPHQTLAEFRAHADDSTSPPGPPDTWLGETIVHSTDIRWPLGLEHEFPMPALVRVADFYKNSNALIGTKRRIEGVALRASDTDWSFGSGPEVSGPMLALVMAMTGRVPALLRLTGDGLAALESRMGCPPAA